MKTNMQKIHDARTVRAHNNIKANDKLFARYGGTYTQTELNFMNDLRPNGDLVESDKDR